jgi:dTDP-4-amino-4,6-dideoxygalactose transaminase
MSAALGLVQVQRLDELLSQRARVAAWYGELLHGVPGIETPSLAPTTTRMSWFVYVVRVRAPLCRDQLMADLGARGIPSRPYFTPIHLQPFYAAQFGYRVGDFPVTEELGRTSLALPFSGVMSRAEVDYVCCAIRELASCLVS